MLNAIAESLFAGFLYLVVNKHPNDPLPLLAQEFLRFVLAKIAQERVWREGHFSIPADVFGCQLKTMLSE
ncbi:hypothetical protein GCM10009114_14190 [Aliiglaciecola litoralis]|uniref:Uncharacterized protein n=1 Tax=Aliiglaciecola litoralis TaxID=582857 RepID=A0ABP3WQP0_9ALTE